MRNVSQLSHIFVLFITLFLITSTPLCFAGSSSSNILLFNQSASVNNLSDLKSEILEKLNERNPSFTIRYRGVTSGLKDEINNIVDEISAKHHYTYFSLSSWKFSFGGFTNNVVISFDVTYLTNREQEQFISSEVDRILDGIIYPYMTDFEEVKAVNDYIVLNTIYSEETKNSPHSPSTILSEGKGVCQAYALLGYRMLDQLGFEVKYVVGNAGEPHAWLLVKLDGEWYHLDMTWNDPVPDKIGNVSYKYFLVNDDYLSRTHTWDTDNYPKATSNNYSFMHLATNAVTFNNTIYFSNESSNNRLYKMNIHGSNKVRLTNNRAYFIAVAGDWIYYSNYSDSGYLYRITKNGNQDQRLNKQHTIDIFELDGWLYYTLANTGEKVKTYVGSNDLGKQSWLDILASFASK